MWKQFLRISQCLVHHIIKSLSCQSKKQRLKEKIEEDVGSLVQFLLDERDSLLESLDAEEVASMAVIDDNLKTVETEEEAISKGIVNIHNQISGKTSFEVST